MISLDPKYLDVLNSLLKKHIPGIPVWAFGSRVNGTATEGSDLDLVVHLPDGSQISLTALREVFRESNLPFTIELLDWAAIPEHFRQEILQKYEVIQ